MNYPIIGAFTKKQKDTWGNWANQNIPVLSLSSPYKCRITGARWAVAYETPSTLGNTGKQTNREYFWRKNDAEKWINTVKKQAGLRA